MTETSPPLTAERALLTARILWGALLAGQVVFMAVVAFLIAAPGSAASGNASTGQLLFYISLGLLVAGVTAGHVVRMQMYKRNWQENAVRPRGYLAGNLVLWALCEAPSLLGLVSCLVSRSLWPGLAVTVLAMATQVVNFPTGRPMMPDQPPFARKN